MQWLRSCLVSGEGSDAGADMASSAGVPKGFFRVNGEAYRYPWKDGQGVRDASS